MPSTRSMKSAAQPPSSRMSLRSFRSVSLVSCSSSSSASASDDSCDSFGSDGGFASTIKRTNLRPAKRMTPPKVFQSPAEEACSAFETAISTSIGAMKVQSEPRRAGRKAAPLKVAMVFPTRKTAPKRAATEPLAGREEEEEEGENFLDKRAINIKENKEMLAKLMAEINKVPGLFPRRMAMSLPSTPRRAHRAQGARWRQQGSSRPQTRSRARADGPSTPTPDKDEEEEDDEEAEDQFSLVRRSRYYEPAPARRTLYTGSLTTTHVVRPVEDITEAELGRICTNVKEKVYNSSTGTTCHQCRQKTTDTKTCCRNPECVGVRGQFCGPCMRNRYGEEVRVALLDTEWRCPPCRGICNCSFCRAREGRCATGVLVYLAQFHGYDNAHAYLKSLKKKLEEDSE